MRSMTFTVAGRVLDRATGRAQPGAIVQLAPWQPKEYRVGLALKEAPTSENGHFFLELSSDEYWNAFGSDEPVFVQLNAFLESQQIGFAHATLGPGQQQINVDINTSATSADGKDFGGSDITIEDASVDLGTFNSPAGGTPGFAPSPEQLVSDTLSQLVGARWTPDAPPARTWQLVDRAFTAEQRGGETEYVWNRKYSVQPGGDVPITGEQAVLLDRAKQSVTEMQSILRSLQPGSTADYDTDEGEAVRSLLVTMLSELLTEMGLVPPRKPKIDTLLDSIGGELERMKDVFRFSGPFVTVEQAGKRTDFDKLEALADQLQNGWVRYLKAQDEPENFGTELVLIWRDLAAVTEMVGDTRVVLASSMVSPAEQQTIYVPQKEVEQGVSIAGILDWAGGLEGYARTLLGEGGLRGAAVLLPYVENLKTLLEQLIAELESQAQEHPGLRRPRVRRALTELDGNLDAVVKSLTRIQAGAGGGASTLQRTGAAFKSARDGDEALQRASEWISSLRAQLAEARSRNGELDGRLAEHSRTASALQSELEECRAEMQRLRTEALVLREGTSYLADRWSEAMQLLEQAAAPNPDLFLDHIRGTREEIRRVRGELTRLEERAGTIEEWLAQWIQADPAKAGRYETDTAVEVEPAEDADRGAQQGEDSETPAAESATAYSDEPATSGSEEAVAVERAEIEEAERAGSADDRGDDSSGQAHRSGAPSEQRRPRRRRTNRS
jgi:hypothetical protein